MMLPTWNRSWPRATTSPHDPPHAGPVPEHAGARAWRRHLSENACKPGAGIQVVLDAMARCRNSPAPSRWSNHVSLHWLLAAQGLVRLCAGLLAILGIKLSAFYFIGLLIVLACTDQLLG